MSPAAEGFVSRHVGPDAPAVATMLQTLGYASLESLINAAVPASIRTDRPLDLPGARSEPQVAAALRAIADQNTPRVPMIGLGYHGTTTPAVIRRNVLESPAWYTSYTPYQAEISQGRLEALLNFQTVVIDLTGLPVAGSSLLDEATAVAESVALMWRATKAAAGTVVLDSELLPQSLAVAAGRAAAIGLPVLVADLSDGLPELDGPLVGVVLQQIATNGTIRDLRPVIDAAHAAHALVTMVVDPLAATLLVSAGDLGADVAVGSAQRFGVPLFGGGPHAAFIAVATPLARTMPGRLVGVSKDADGSMAYRLALQTREQHIRREKATSNICTAQALLAIVASMYAVYHGPDGLRAIAADVRAKAGALIAGLQSAPLVAAGVVVETGAARATGTATAWGAATGATSSAFFDTVRWVVPGAASRVVAAAAARGIDIWQVDADRVQASTSEVTTSEHIADLLAAVAAVALGAGGAAGGALSGAVAAPADNSVDGPADLPAELTRTDVILTHPVFHRYRSETALMRYLRLLSDKDLALDRTMIPLGSCTMKLNAAVEMEPISLPQFADVHPFAPADTVGGYEHLVTELQGWLAEITGYAAVSIQPNAGSQGEFAGLLAVRGYLSDQRSLALARGADPDLTPERDVCLIPASAHGTNAASAAMAGLRVVVVATSDDGAIDLDNLRARLAEYGPRVAVLMLTYPSTHGVYEEDVREVADLVHAAGGQVYVDGANLNALVGLARPGEFGGDVSHLNLHKTFCIPHGGGGPGVGPVAVAAHLAPYLPGDPTPNATNDAATTGVGFVPATTPAAPVSAARFGSAGILPISWAYIALMGPDGLRRASEVAVLAANYLAARLTEYYPVLFTGPGGLVAHECILDLRAITKETGVTAEDVAKRLMDYGFHAPTLAFPVPGTLMVEPTESEDIAELDRFVDAMIAIRAEIDAVAAGTWPLADSPLRNAPHTAACLVADEWTHPYTREQAAFGVPGLRAGKYWPAVRRIDGAFGDRNLVCACPPVEAFAEEPSALTAPAALATPAPATLATPAPATAATAATATATPAPTQETTR